MRMRCILSFVGQRGVFCCFDEKISIQMFRAFLSCFAHNYFFCEEKKTFIVCKCFRQPVGLLCSWLIVHGLQRSLFYFICCFLWNGQNIFSIDNPIGQNKCATVRYAAHLRHDNHPIYHFEARTSISLSYSLHFSCISFWFDLLLHRVELRELFKILNAIRHLKRQRNRFTTHVKQCNCTVFRANLWFLKVKTKADSLVVHMDANGFIEELFKLKAKLLQQNHAKRTFCGKRKWEEMSKREKPKHVRCALCVWRLL